MYICVIDIATSLLDTGNVKAEVRHVGEYAVSAGREEEV